MKIHGFVLMATGLLTAGTAGLSCARGGGIFETSGSGGYGGEATTTSTTASTDATSSISASASSTSSTSASSSASASSNSATSSTSASTSSTGATSSSSSGQSAPTGITFTGLDYSTQYGSPSGGQAHEDPCPAGQVVIGYLGFLHKNGYHGQIQAQCGIPAVTGSAAPFAVTITAGARTPLEGGQGLPPGWTLACPADHVVVGFSGRCGSLLDFLSLDCAPLSITGSPGSYTVTVGAVTSLPGVGDQGGQPFPHTSCSPGDVATENHVRAGDGIDAFGIGCSKPVVTP